MFSRRGLTRLRWRTLLKGRQKDQISDTPTDGIKRKRHPANRIRGRLAPEKPQERPFLFRGDQKTPPVIRATYFNAARTDATYASTPACVPSMLCAVPGTFMKDLADVIALWNAFASAMISGVGS